MLSSLEAHWLNYVIEALLLGTFMLSACTSVTLAAHPLSPLARRIRRPLARRALVGAAMGITAILLITSPPGRLSGAHMNPATTITFALLGKIAAWDALLYSIAQFIGGIAGVALALSLFPSFVKHPNVNCVITQPPEPGRRAAWRAFGAEAAMTFVLFGTVLLVSNTPTIAHLTPYFVGLLVMVYITFEAPISGMSMNPARTLASALGGRSYRALWVYFSAPLLGMVGAAGVYAGTLGTERVYCCKLDHSGNERCIFHCRIPEMRSAGRSE